MTYGTQVFPENIDYIIATAKDWGLNLDYLHSNVEFNAEDGWNTFVVMDGGFETGKPIVINDMTESAFNQHWRFITDHNAPYAFRLIERKL